MRKAYAIFGCVATVIIAAVGLSGYSAGTRYITWFGIQLSQGGFIALLFGFAVLDFFAVKKAFGADMKVEEAQSAALARAKDAERLEGEPCRVTLTRLPSAIGSAMGVRVFLNGVEQETLRNGKTIVMQTGLAKNELQVLYNADGAGRTLQFDAEPGGSLRVTLKYTGAVLTLQDSAVADPGEPDHKGRYRPVRKGYILWAILNMPIYLLGLVPLVKTLRAAKQPYDDVAANQLRSAKIWNIVLSCLLVIVVPMVARIIASTK